MTAKTDPSTHTNRKWTEAEDAVIIAGKSGPRKSHRSYESMSAELGRTKSQIKNRLDRLPIPGRTVSKHTGIKNDWSTGLVEPYAERKLRRGQPQPSYLDNNDFDHDKALPL